MMLRFLLLGMLMLTASACSSQVPFRMRILTYNVHHGEGLDKKIDLGRIASLIDSLSPDLVALQEVDQKTQRSDGVDQLEVLANLTGLHPAGGGHLDYGGGKYGNAILSRFPAVQQKQIDLPQAATNGEARSASIAEFEPGDPRGPQKVVFVSTHFDIGRDEAHRLESAKTITKEIQESYEASQPVILAGDFNSRFESKTVELLNEDWFASNTDYPRPTYPAGNPKIQIDYVFVRPGREWKIVSTQVVEEEVASDHRPLLVVLEWRGRE